MTSMHIDHINIKAAPALLVKVRDFYCQVLGLNEGFRPAFRDIGYWLYAGELAIIHLSENIGHGTGENNGAFDHFAIRVTDLSPIVAGLDKTGVEYTSAYVADIGVSQLFFKDPAGTGVEVQCPDNSI